MIKPEVVPEPLNLDGCYSRINRGGKEMNLCFSDLSKREQEQIMQNKDIEWFKALCGHLADRLREVGG